MVVVATVDRVPERTVKGSVARKAVVSDKQCNITASDTLLGSDNCFMNLIVPVGCGQRRTSGGRQWLYKVQLWVRLYCAMGRYEIDEL